MANSHFQSCLMAALLLWELFLRHRHIGELLMVDSLRSWVAVALLPRFDFLWSFSRKKGGKILLIQNLTRYLDGIWWYFDVSLSQNLRITRPRNWLAGTKVQSITWHVFAFLDQWKAQLRQEINAQCLKMIKKSQKFVRSVINKFCIFFLSKNSSNCRKICTAQLECK